MYVGLGVSKFKYPIAFRHRRYPPSGKTDALFTYTDMPPKTEKEFDLDENQINSEADAHTPVQQSADSSNANAPMEPRAESRYAVGDIRTEPIRTCVAIIPTSGSNAGRQMYVINGTHWTRQEPQPTHNTLVLQYTSWKAKDGSTAFGWNVQGTNVDAFSLTIDQKIAKVVAHDASYSQALALLLK